MPGSAVLGTNLVDELVPDVIDGIRADLHPALGVRQFNFFVITRTWASGEIGGGGPFTDVFLGIGVAGTLDPQPLVKPYKSTEGRGFTLEPCGIDNADALKMEEVSMTFTEEELGSPFCEFPDGVEKFLQLVDAHGQGNHVSYWRHHVRPFNDREETMGWMLTLESTSTPEGL